MSEEKYEIVKFVDGELELEVNVSPKEDTIWMSQMQIAELFETTKQNVSLHINNIFKDCELDKTSVVKDFFTTAIDGKKYKITYDVYVDVTTDCACTAIQTKLWNPTGFNTYGKVALGAWHTVEIDLQYLLDNWGNYRLFGLNFCNQAGLTRGTDMVEFWLGNIQLVEGEALGVPALKTTVNA